MATTGARDVRYGRTRRGGAGTDAGAVTASVPALPRRVRPYRTPRAPVVAIATPPITTGSSIYAWRRVRAAYRRVYDSRHLQADSQEPGSAPEPYAR